MSKTHPYKYKKTTHFKSENKAWAQKGVKKVNNHLSKPITAWNT